jgi:hypothetical protein
MDGAMMTDMLRRKAPPPPDAKQSGDPAEAAPGMPH